MIHWLPYFGKWICWDRALKEMPNVASELGLKYEMSETKDHIGKLSGHYKGHRVTIDVDDQKIHVYLKQKTHVLAKKLELSTSPDRLRDKPEDFITDNKAFNKYFVVKRVPQEYQDILLACSDFADEFIKLKKDFGAQFGYVSLCNSYILIGHYNNKGFCDTKHGHMYMSKTTWDHAYHIPPEFLIAFIPRLVEWLEIIEDIE